MTPTTNPSWRTRIWTRLREVLSTPGRLLERERRAREIAGRTSDPDVLEDRIDVLVDDLRAYAKTTDYTYAIDSSTNAGPYADHVDELDAEIRAHVRAWVLLRREQVERVRRERATSADSGAPSRLERVRDGIRQLLP